MGKIDLSSLNQSTRPKKKSKEEAVKSVKRRLVRIMVRVRRNVFVLIKNVLTSMLQLISSRTRMVRRVAITAIIRTVVRRTATVIRNH